MDIYLISTDSQELNLTQMGSNSARFVTDYPAGAFGFPEVEHQVDRDINKQYRLMDTFQRSIVVDLTLQVMGKTIQNLLDELSGIFSKASFSKTPLKLKIVEGSKTVYLDVHPQSSSVVPNLLTSEVKLRLVSYGKWYYGTETSISLLSNQSMQGDYSRIFRVANPASGAPILETIATPSSKSTNFVALGAGLTSDLYFGIDGSDTINGVTVNRIGAMDSSHTVRAISGIVDGSVTSIILGASDTGYVAGTFTRAGGSVGDYIGRLSFNVVTKLNEDGLNAVPKGFCFYKHDILAFGSFTQTSTGQNARRLIALSGGTTFTEFGGSGANGDVNCVINYKDGIVIGGNFTSVGGVSVTKLCYWSDTQIFSFPLPQTNGYPVVVYKYKDNLYLVWYNSGVISYYVWNGSGWTFMFTTTEDYLRVDTPNPIKLWNREVIFGYKGIYEIRGKSLYKVFGNIDPILSVKAFDRIYVVKEKLPNGWFLEIPKFIQVNSPSKIAPRIEGYTNAYGVPVQFDVTNIVNGGITKITPYLVSETLYVDCNTGEVYTKRGLDLKTLDSIYDPCQRFRLEKGVNYIFKYPPSGTSYSLKIPLQFDTLAEALAWS